MATYQFSGVGRIDYCAECPMCYFEHDDQLYYCELTDHDVVVHRKESDCPLVLVKED